MVPPRPAVVLPEFDNVLFCRRNEPDLAAAKRRLIRPPAMMPGFVLAAGRVVAEWSAPDGNLVRLDWHNPSPAVLSEWEQFAAWYRAMPVR